MRARRPPGPLVGLMFVAMAVATWVGVGWRACAAPRTVVATFNVENFPRNPAQIEGAVATMRELGAPVIAVQEITRPDVLRDAIRDGLGSDWRFVTHPEAGAFHRVGVLYDSAAYTMDYARAHDSVRLTPNGRPALEVRLLGQAGRSDLRVFVVHLKAGADHVATRQAQLARLTALVRPPDTDADRVVVLGDFNSATAADRDLLDRFAADTGFGWRSRDLRCTALHRGPDGCRGSALDHVFASWEPEVSARGPCAGDGCDPGDRCPTFVDQVSDHCPVVGR